MIEVVGFLSAPNDQSSANPLETVMETEVNGSSEEAMETDSTKQNVTDLQDEHVSVNQPSIHAVLVKVITNCNPLLFETAAESEKASAIETQKDLLKILTEFSFGDELAAQYILLHLISRIYARVGGEVLGKFSLNLVCSSIPQEILSEYGKMLTTLFEMLVPNSLYLPLTIENFNTKQFVPKKDYKTNRLETGFLQIPNHSHLILDETKLESGKLEAQGCLALQDLSELIKSQQLQYDFQFYKIPFNTDIPTLIISEGKSLLPVIDISFRSNSISLNSNISAERFHCYDQTRS